MTAISFNDAWLAGLLEGDGCFQCRKTSGTLPTVSVTFASTDKDVVERVALEMEGPVAIQKKAANGYKCLYRCTVYSTRAERIMQRILPWMGRRREKVIVDALKRRGIL